MGVLFLTGGVAVTTLNLHGGVVHSNFGSTLIGVRGGVHGTSAEVPIISLMGDKFCFAVARSARVRRSFFKARRYIDSSSELSTASSHFLMNCLVTDCGEGTF